jgi:isoamylase
MTDEHWTQDFAKSLGVYLNGRGIRSVGPKGEQIIDDNFYIIFNAHHEPLIFMLPSRRYGDHWYKILDTNTGIIENKGARCKAGDKIEVESRSTIIFRQPLDKK